MPALFGVEFTTVGDAVMYILGTLMDWLTVLIVLVLIYMLFELITGGEGLGGLKNLFGGGKDPSGKPPKKSTVVPDPELEKEIAEAEKAGKGLDPSNPGTFQVYAKDEDGTPIDGVEIHVYPRGYKREWFWRKKNPRLMHYHGYTNRDGIAPADGNPGSIGSGVVTIEAQKVGWYNITWFAKGKFYDKTDWPIKGGEHHVIPICFRQKGERPGMFHPKIMQVKVEDGKLVLEGQIKEGAGR